MSQGALPRHRGQSGGRDSPDRPIPRGRLPRSEYTRAKGRYDGSSTVSEAPSRATDPASFQTFCPPELTPERISPDHMTKARGCNAHRVFLSRVGARPPRVPPLQGRAPPHLRFCAWVGPRGPVPFRKRISLRAHSRKGVLSAAGRQRAIQS